MKEETEKEGEKDYPCIDSFFIQSQQLGKEQGGEGRSQELHPDLPLG